MKKALSWLLCIFLLLSCLCGCAPEDAPYVPTGDALAGENEGDAPVATQGDAEQALTLAYYPAESLNPYLCTD